MIKLLVIHGPNLNLLGEREPEVYGSLTLNQLNEIIREFGKSKGVNIAFCQSNHEGEIIDFIHQNRNLVQGIVINPAALTHYSYALRDAISAIVLPVVEVHLSDIYKREKFRHISVIKEVCLCQISGMGIKSYLQGIEKLIQTIQAKKNGR